MRKMMCVLAAGLLIACAGAQKPRAMKLPDLGLGFTPPGGDWTVQRNVQTELMGEQNVLLSNAKLDAEVGVNVVPAETAPFHPMTAETIQAVIQGLTEQGFRNVDVGYDEKRQLFSIAAEIDLGQDQNGQPIARQIKYTRLAKPGDPRSAVIVMGQSSVPSGPAMIQALDGVVNSLQSL